MQRTFKTKILDKTVVVFQYIINRTLEELTQPIKNHIGQQYMQHIFIRITDRLFSISVKTETIPSIHNEYKESLPFS